MKAILLALLMFVLPGFCFGDDKSDVAKDETTAKKDDAKKEKDEAAPLPKPVQSLHAKLKKAELSKEQKERVDELIAEIRESLGDARGKEREQLLKDFHYEVVEYVLNKDQRAKLGLAETPESAKTPKAASAVLKKLGDLKLDARQKKQLERLVVEVSASFADAQS